MKQITKQAKRRKSIQYMVKQSKVFQTAIKPVRTKNQIDLGKAYLARKKSKLERIK